MFAASVDALKATKDSDAGWINFMKKAALNQASLKEDELLKRIQQAAASDPIPNLENLELAVIEFIFELKKDADNIFKDDSDGKQKLMDIENKLRRYLGDLGLQKDYNTLVYEIEAAKNGEGAGEDFHKRKQELEGRLQEFRVKLYRHAWTLFPGDPDHAWKLLSLAVDLGKRSQGFIDSFRSLAAEVDEHVEHPEVDVQAELSRID